MNPRPDVYWLKGRKSLLIWRMDPCCASSLFQLADQEYFWLINIHHIIIDEWSLDLLFQELQQLYPAQLTGQSVDLPDLPVQYADYAVWQAEWLQVGVMEKQLGYWKEKLAGAPQVIEIKPDFPRPAVLELSWRTSRAIIFQAFARRIART